MTEEELLASLPPFEARTGRRAARALCRRLGEGASLVLAAAAALDEREALRARFGAALDARFAAVPDRHPAAMRAAFEVACGHAAGRADQRAMATGRLGPDALAERAHARAVRLEAEALVGFLAAQAQALRAAVLEPPLAELGARMACDASWRLARAALLGLAAHARAGRPPPAGVAALAHRVASDGDAATWTRTAALELLAALPDGAAALERALAPAPTPDHLFVRAAAARLLAAARPDAARALLPALAHDPSEHVRMELAALLAPLGALAPLRRLADPARERSPRVRAAAAIALAPHDPAALARILDEDPDEIPRRAALEEAEPRAEHDEALRRAIERLAVAAPTAELCRLAAEAAERLHHRLDAGAGAALRAAADAIADVPERASARLLAPLPPDTLGRALAVLSTADHGLQAARGRRGWRILRGDRLRRVVWRVLHEVRNPSPDKRQSYGHCVGRLAFGEVRAPAGGLAEVTATKVPGERVVVPALGDWGRHLPTPDDLLAWPRGGRLSLFSAFGITRVRFPSPPRWLAARVALTTRYAAYARLRWRALTGAEWRDRREYLRRLERLGFVFGFEPYRAAGPTEVVELYQPGAPAAAPPAGAAALLAPAGELLRRWLDPATSTVNHLAAVGFATLALFYLRLREARRELERARAAIPLSIGGWGTRGKSGTERLKAALFQALGCEVLVKTTGCEAMLIHCLPGLPAHELFIYRTYDKASIWEQRDLVTLAERLGVDVFLWECMALNPGYVEILEQHWMRDDFCTLTNAYPDHENIQGPAGIDVPRVMARFVPRGRTLFTAEEQMFPIVRDAAAAAETEVVQVRWRDHALLPADLLARFPYEEHPRNIALVLELAARLGVDRTMALKEMADWVVPDLGVLKTYPEVSWRGRRLVFSNGMSANERTGFLNNWARCGFDRHQPDDVGEWIVTVVNNRADRVSRSMVFADVVVDDAAAHAHVLIGTNLTGLVGFIGAALARRVAGLALVHPDEATLPPERLEPLALARAERALKRVMLGELGAGRLAREADAMAAGLGASARVAPETFAAAVVAGQPTLAATRAAVRPLLEPRLASFAAALGAQGADAVRHLLESCARHAAVLRWRRDLAAVLRAGLDALRRHEVAFRALVRELSLATLVPLWDAALSGDQVIDAVTRACPPGYRVRIMGVQNIKGTGLDFAYRWVGLEATARRAAQLEARAGAEAVRLARALAEAEGLGVLDCALAEPAIRAAAGREPEPHRAELLAAAARLHERLAEREAALARTATAATRRWLRPLEELLDVWDGIWRRRRAERVMAELTAGRLAHPTAAAELRELMKRQKGGWLLKR